MATKVDIHETFRHDCSEWPEGFESFKATTPYQFRKGDEVEVPDDAADYFIRAGWAALPGEKPVKPDRGRPVFVQPESGKLGQRSSSP